MASSKALLLAGTCCVLLGLSGQAAAQVGGPSSGESPAGAPGEAQTSASDTASAHEGEGLADIVVTAQKRSQNLQDVPIALTVLGEGALDRAGIVDIRAMEQLVPGLNADVKASATHFFLRGVGIATNSPGQDPPVAVYVDDVYIPSATAATMSLNNIERIEVLKGPQGTLFGRNAAAGVISIHTKKPSHEPEVEADVGYASYDTITARAYGSTGLAEGVAANLALYYNRQGDGWGTNVVTGEDVRKGRSFAARARLKADLGRTASILFGAWYENQKNDFGSFAVLPGTFAVGGTPHLGGFWDINVDAPQYSESTNRGLSARFEYDLGFASLVNVAAFQQVKAHYFIDNDVTPRPIAGNEYRWTEQAVTNELQLVSASGGSVDWVVGLYYLQGDIDPYRLITTGTSTPAGRILNSSLETKSIAPFGQATIHVFSGTEVTVGARYTRDERHIRGRITNSAGTPIPPVSDQQKAFKKLTFRLALQQHLNDDVSVYASFNRGFKAGIFGIVAPSDPAANPEVLDAYEIGIKSQLLDRRLRLNAALFHYDYSNLQVRSVRPGPSPLFQVLNAASARIRGADVDFEAVLTKGLTVSGGFSYLDAKFEDFPLAPLWTPRPAAQGGNVQVIGSASGKKLPRSPRLSTNVGIHYQVAVGSDELSLSANYAYKSSIYFDPDNRIRQSPFSVASASATWTFGDTGISIGAWGNNLFNAKYISDEVPSGNYTSFAPGSPRTYGVRVGIKY